jgi:hypothetical protein
MKITTASTVALLLAASVQAQAPDASRSVSGSVEAVAAEVDVLVLDGKGTNAGLRGSTDAARFPPFASAGGRGGPAPSRVPSSRFAYSFVDMVLPFQVEIAKDAPNDGFFRHHVDFQLDRKWKGRLFLGIRDQATNQLGAATIPIGG